MRSRAEATLALSEGQRSGKERQRHLEVKYTIIHYAWSKTLFFGSVSPTCMSHTQSPTGKLDQQHTQPTYTVYKLENKEVSQNRTKRQKDGKYGEIFRSRPKKSTLV